MNTILLYLVQGLVVLGAFYLGAFVYQKGQANSSVIPQLNLNKNVDVDVEKWDQM